MLFTEATTIAALITGLGYPLYILINSKKAIQYLKENPDKLSSTFRLTGIILVIMTLIVLGSMVIESVDVTTIGLGFIYSPLWVLGIIGLSIIFFLFIRKMQIPDSKKDSLSKSFEGIEYIMPTNALEYKWSVAISFVAGITEEIIFRGFLFSQLNQYMHWVLAILLVNFLFSVGHANTGLKNAIKTFGLGLFFSIIYIITDSLWLAILTHILVDLYMMTLAFKFSELTSQKHSA